MSSELLKVDFFTGLTGVYPVDLISAPHVQRGVVTHSIDRYTGGFNISTGGKTPIQTYAKDFLKQPAQATNPTPNFVLLPHHNFGRGNMEPFKPYFFGGEQNLLLLNKDTPTEGAVVGFDILDRRGLQRYKNTTSSSQLREGDLVIVQLQGATGIPVEQVLQPYKWEEMLVQLVCDWAESVGYPRVLLLPSIYHNQRGIIHEDRAYLPDFDLIAKRSGFNRTVPNGIWMKELPAYEMFKALFSK